MGPQVPLHPSDPQELGAQVGVQIVVVVVDVVVVVEVVVVEDVVVLEVVEVVDVLLVVVGRMVVVVVVVDGGTQSRQQSVRSVATTPPFAVHLLADFWMLQPGTPSSSSSSSAGAPGTRHTTAPFFPQRDFAAHSTTASRHSLGIGRRFAFFATQLM